MALLSSYKSELGSDVGIQRILNRFYANSFQLTNKIWCSIVPPTKLVNMFESELGSAFDYDFFMDITNTYTKSTNIPNINNKIEPVNYSGNIVEYTVGHAPKDPISLSFYADRKNVARYVMESWKSLSCPRYPSRLAYRNEVVGKIMMYSIVGMDKVVDSVSMTDEERGRNMERNMIKDAGKYLVRQTGLMQFSDMSPLKLPKNKIKLDISNVRIYQNVEPYEIGTVVRDKADEAGVEILPVNFVWEKYVDLGAIDNYSFEFFFDDGVSK